MAIRLEHQPVGISGLAAYAAGSGRKRERDLKYGVQLAQQGQGRRDKYNLQANQQAFSLQRDADQREFTLDRDEIRDAITLDRERDRERWYTEREERAHKRDDFEHERDKGYDAFKHGRSVYEDAVGRGLLALAIPTPEGVPKELLEKIEANREAMRKFTDGTFDLDDKESGPAFEKAYREHQRLLGLIPERSATDKSSENIVTLGGSTYQYVNGKLELLPKDDDPQQARNKDLYRRADALRKERYGVGDPAELQGQLKYPERQGQLEEAKRLQGIDEAFVNPNSIAAGKIALDKAAASPSVMDGNQQFGGGSQGGQVAAAPTPQQRAAMPGASRTIKDARAGVPEAIRALKERGISY